MDDTVKTKRFFVRQRKRYRSSRSNREFFTFSWRERFVPFLSSSKNSDRVHKHFDLVEVIGQFHASGLSESRFLKTSSVSRLL